MTAAMAVAAAGEERDAGEESHGGGRGRGWE